MTRKQTFPGSLALAAALPGLLFAQGLGDAARREQQRREGSRQAGAGKTYTDADVQGLAPIANDPQRDPSTTASGPPQPAAAPAPAPAPQGRGRTAALGEDKNVSSPGVEDQETRRKLDEERWRTRVAQARARVEKAREEHAHLASLHMVPGMSLVDDNGKVAVGSVEHLQWLTARAKAELAAAQQTLDDLLEQARRAGVPPGWLR